MIINRNGAEFEYKGVSFVIGQPVVGTSQSEYEGLYGLITEIRDGEDKETENDTPDIYLIRRYCRMTLKNWRNGFPVCIKILKNWRISVLMK